MMGEKNSERRFDFDESSLRPGQFGWFSQLRSDPNLDNFVEFARFNWKQRPAMRRVPVQSKPGHLWPGKSKNYYEEHTTPFGFAVANSRRKRHAAVAVLVAMKIAAFCCRST